VYGITALHTDADPPNLAWMVLLQGRKVFWFLPPGSKKISKDDPPVFISEEAVGKHLHLGLRMVELHPGDLLVFPGAWLHEVHNLEPNIVAITNAVPFPKKPEEKLKVTQTLPQSSMVGKKRFKVSTPTTQDLLYLGEVSKTKRRAYIQTHNRLGL